MKFLRQDGPIVDMLNRFIDLIILSAITFICCLPVFTIGAAVSALYDVAMNFALHREPGIFRTYFGAFKRCFKRGTGLFFLFLFIGLFIGIDLWSAFQWDISGKYVFIVVIMAVGYFYLAVVTHVYPVLAYFDTGIRETIRKAFFLSMKNGIYTVFIMLTSILPVLLIYCFPNYLEAIVFLWFILGTALIAYLNSLHLVRLFDPDLVKEIEENLHKEPEEI